MYDVCHMSYDDSDGTHAYDEPTVVCWLGQTISPVDFVPPFPPYMGARQSQLELTALGWPTGSLDWVSLAGRFKQGTALGGPTCLALRWVSPCWAFYAGDDDS